MWVCRGEGANVIDAESAMSLDLADYPGQRKILPMPG